MLLGVVCFVLALGLVFCSIRIDLLSERVSRLEDNLDTLKEETKLEIDTLKI